MNLSKQMEHDAQTLNADQFARKYDLHPGNFAAQPRATVAKSLPKVQPIPDREPTEEEKQVIAQAGERFISAHPFVARIEANTNLLQQWFLEHNALPTPAAFEAAFEAIADQLTYQIGDRLITPDEIPYLSAEEFRQLTKKQATADVDEPLENLSAAQVKERIQEIEEDEGIKSEATLIALATLYPKGTETGDAARVELREVRQARRNDLNNIPGIVIAQRERLISTVLEQRPHLLNGFSREEVSDALLTHLEKCSQSWSLQSLNAAAEQLEEWGELPRSNSPTRAGIRVVENPRFPPPVPDREVEIVERVQKFTREHVEAMSAEDFQKNLRNPDFVKALNDLS